MMKKMSPGEGLVDRPEDGGESDVEGHSLGDRSRMPIESQTPSSPDGIVPRPRSGGELVEDPEE